MHVNFQARVVAREQNESLVFDVEAPPPNSGLARAALALREVIRHK
jgi:hypothetical protein